MLNRIYKEDVNQIIKQAEIDNKNMYSYAMTIDKLTSVEEMENSLRVFANAVTRDENNLVFVGNEKSFQRIAGEMEIKDNSVSSDIVTTAKGTYIQVVSHINTTYMMNRYSLNGAIAKRNSNFQFYERMIVIISMTMAVILFLVSKYISRPLVKLKEMAEKISVGDYSTRIDADIKKMKSLETKKLGETMNIMAENVQDNIDELERMIQKREEFIGDFTHEIKTPLTSIIGYGDMLRTFDLPAEKRREYGDYIYKEGKRLEKLSLNLLQIIAMGKSEIELSIMNAKTIFGQIEKSCRFLEEKYQVHIVFDIRDGFIKVEPSLYITMILNFIDNACKASEVGKRIKIMGRQKQNEYVVKIVDEGKGIPEEDIEKIMEPFYMVDKSRARSQGGAGLGLALCKKISELLCIAMDIQSELNGGTIITLSMKSEVGK